MIKKSLLIERYKRIWFEKTGDEIDIRSVTQKITSHSMRWSNSKYSKEFIKKRASNLILDGDLKKRDTILYYSQTGKIYLFESYTMYKTSLEYEVFKELLRT